jgi:hypothetical protein
MSRRDDDDDDIEAGERDPLAGSHNDSPPHPRYVPPLWWRGSDEMFSRPTRSIHAMTRDEIRKGIANRVIHSRTYIFLYLGMIALSISTVVLSIREGCPGLAFYILEVIINSAMIAEVTIRFLAFGRVSDIVTPNQDVQLIGDGTLGSNSGNILSTFSILS